jgi:hypothetical protein
VEYAVKYFVKYISKFEFEFEKIIFLSFEGISSTVEIDRVGYLTCNRIFDFEIIPTRTRSYNGGNYKYIDAILYNYLRSFT